MPRSGPHPLALFSLIPVNEKAKSVVDHPENEPFRSTSKDGTRVLDVGHMRSKSRRSGVVATLGRDGDIYVEGSNILGVQCSFEIEPEVNVIVCYDRSSYQSTQFSGDTARPFENGRPRKGVIEKGLKMTIGMGGVNCNLVMFDLEWHGKPDDTEDQIKKRQDLTYKVHPCLARTLHDTDPADTSQRVTRIHTPGSSGQPKIRYTMKGEIGEGSFATVHKALDTDAAKLVAVKIMKPLPTSLTPERREGLQITLKREVEVLDKCQHPNIINLIAAQGDFTSDLVLILDLMEGDVESFIVHGGSIDCWDYFYQNLLAADYLARIGWLHRDIKPANTFLRRLPDGRHHFTIGDFGLCNRTGGQTTSGTPIFMAPELSWRYEQTPKVDVWSIGVSILWVLDIQDFRRACNSVENAAHISKMISNAWKDRKVWKVREMGHLDPNGRPSAAQLLAKCFKKRQVVNSATSHRIVDLPAKNS